MLKTLAKLATAAAITAALITPALASTDTTKLLRDANRTVTNMRHDPAFSQARKMIDQARAIYIVPKLIKGGFIFGAEGGDGVLLERTKHGWSDPRFYGMGSVSYGLQAGLEKAELVFIINSDRALRGIKAGNFKVGGNGGITVATLSAGAEAATTLHGGDMVVWTSATGAYGGLTLNGSVIKPDKDENAAYRTSPEAEVLRKNLDSL